MHALYVFAYMHFACRMAVFCFFLLCGNTIVPFAKEPTPPFFNWSLHIGCISLGGILCFVMHFSIFLAIPCKGNTGAWKFDGLASD